MGGHTPQRFRRTISLGVGALFRLSLVQVFPGSVRPTPAAAAATYPPVRVFVGYADNLRSSPFFPNPWNGSANPTFVGSPVNGISTQVPFALTTLRAARSPSVTSLLTASRRKHPRVSEAE